MCEIRLNSDKNGIELRFAGKPDAELIEAMKAHGFRWSGKQKMWYARRSDDRLAFSMTIGTLSDAAETKDEKDNGKNKNAAVDLWMLTRTDDIRDNYAETHLHSTKEIARILREHIKSRFPMCRWSVRSDYSSIDLDLLTSPFAKDSAELKAIVHYAAAYAASWNYDNSDLMSDYHDVNFYGCYESGIVSYDYEQREATEDELAMTSAFEASLAAFDEAERIREEQERAEAQARMERERAESEAYERKRQEQRVYIEESADVRNTHFFAFNCIAPRCNKLDSVEAIEKAEKGDPEICEVTRAVFLPGSVYRLFSSQLLDDYSFLAGFGGHKTDDLRVKSDLDFMMMSEEEQKTVQWYNTNCVAVYSDGVLKLIVNPEGHDYARYAYLVDETANYSDSFESAVGMDREAFEKACVVAEMIEEASTELIFEHGLVGTWNNSLSSVYKTLMRDWIREHLGSRFNVDAVRQITIPELKEVMYDILKTPVPAAEQLASCGLKEGDKFSLISLGEFCWMTCTNGVFHSWETKKWAQYDDNIRLVFKPDRKRGLYEVNLHSEFLIYPGYVQIPDDVLWEKTDSASTPGITCRKTRFLSCDKKQFDAVIDHFKAEGILPIVNTYKPIFG